MGATPLLRSQRNLADLLGEEFSENLSSTDTEDAAAVNPKVRLLRDLRFDTRSKSTWARLFNDYNNPKMCTTPSDGLHVDDGLWKLLVHFIVSLKVPFNQKTMTLLLILMNHTPSLYWKETWRKVLSDLCPCKLSRL
ncbi:hypothetical protein scyTo_0004002 [Scyliorhinus torazame]|uniref:Uncharacterized protein n=1 Tax=Scyliorhinus torazame TaxID=75743 RepID=A0A401NIT7_SCYTO|nr:hypothetical protein [Scyliorhinus torazame]